MKIPWRSGFTLVMSLAAFSCDRPARGSGARTDIANSNSALKLPPAQETLQIMALHESAIRDAWGVVGDRMLAGEAEIIYESSFGKMKFIRAEEPLDEPSSTYLVGGPISGSIEIARKLDKVERVIMRPGEFGFPYLQTTVTLYDVNQYDPFEDTKRNSDAEQVVAPNRSLPPSQKSTSPVRGPED